MSCASTFGWRLTRAALLAVALLVCVPQVLAVTVVLLALMVGLSMMQTRYQELGWIFRPPAAVRQERFSGD